MKRKKLKSSAEENTSPKYAYIHYIVVFSKLHTLNIRIMNILRV